MHGAHAPSQGILPRFARAPPWNYSTQTRLELVTSAVTGRRSNQLSHWALTGIDLLANQCCGMGRTHFASVATQNQGCALAHACLVACNQGAKVYKLYFQNFIQLLDIIIMLIKMQDIVSYLILGKAHDLLVLLS